MDEIRDFLSGASTLPMTNEGDWESALDEEIEAGKKAIEDDPGTQIGWVQYVYGSAVKRNIRYGNARRGELLALGANNAFREIYEGSRQAADANHS